MIGFGINVSAVSVAILSILVTLIFLGTNFLGVAGSIIVGLAAGWIIGHWTERVTSDEYPTTKKLAEQAETGSATVIIGGVADGMKSVWVPVIVVCAATLLAFGFANGWRFDDVGAFALGLYGVGIAAVGMLSTLGIKLSRASVRSRTSGLSPAISALPPALSAIGP